MAVITYRWLNLEANTIYLASYIGKCLSTSYGKFQGGNFHLKVEGPKAVAMLVTLCWGFQ